MWLILLLLAIRGECYSKRAAGNPGGPSPDVSNPSSCPERYASLLRGEAAALSDDECALIFHFFFVWGLILFPSQNLSEQYAAGLVELVKQSQPYLVKSDVLVLDLNTDELDDGLLRQMEQFLIVNNIVSEPLRRPVPVEPTTEPTAVDVKSEPQHSLEANRNAESSSSSSDDEEGRAPNMPANVPAPSPSMQAPKLFVPEAPTGGPIEVNEASWGSLANSADKQGMDVDAKEEVPLWSEFKNRTAIQQQLEKEKEERELAAKRAAQKQQDDQRRLVEESAARERAEKEQREREREAEIARLREEERQRRQQEAPQVDLLEQSNIMKEMQQSLNDGFS